MLQVVLIQKQKTPQHFPIKGLNLNVTYYIWKENNKFFYLSFTMALKAGVIQ